MTAKDLMRAGQLSEARALLIEEVKAAPADTARRTLLFQVLALQGEWDKALKHLDMISTQDPQRVIGAQAYRNMVLAEQERLKVLALAQTPSVLPEPPAYLGTYLRYLGALKDGTYDAARTLIAEIDAARPAIAGLRGGASFEGFADTDAALCAFLEAFVHERYCWIPFEAIRELIVHPPQSSFDLIWAMASITTWGGLSMNCALPVVYAETFRQDDAQLTLGRLTAWTAMGGGFAQGMGQHVYQVGDQELGLLEIGEVQFRMTEGEG